MQTFVVELCGAWSSFVLNCELSRVELSFPSSDFEQPTLPIWTEFFIVIYCFLAVYSDSGRF